VVEDVIVKQFRFAILSPDEFLVKILSMTDSKGNFARKCYEGFPPHLMYVTTLIGAS